MLLLCVSLSVLLLKGDDTLADYLDQTEAEKSRTDHGPNSKSDGCWEDDGIAEAVS